MPSLKVGKTTIPYKIRESVRAKRMRIVVTPGNVEVVVPGGTTAHTVTGFITAKRRWVFDKLQEVTMARHQQIRQQYASGAKLLYRGRRLMLVIKDADVDHVKISCRSRFHVDVPRKLTKSKRELTVAEAFDTWLKERVLADIQRLTHRYAALLDQNLKGTRLGGQKRMWGTCGRDNIIRINWELIKAPVAALEYVVAHETVHLKHRHHGPTFWRTLGDILPDWRERKTLLEKWEREMLKAAHREV